MGARVTDPLTPLDRRQALALKHRRAAAQAHHSQRQRARLRLLQRWGRRYPTQPSPAQSPRRVLVIRPDHLGDLLFATPALHALRSQFAGAQITALVGPWSEPVLANNPDVDQVLTCAFPGFTRRAKGHPLAPYRFLQQEATRLRDMRFDLALILRFDHWWGAWLAAAAGIPRRIGYDVPEVRPFLTQAAPYVPGRHEVVQNLALALAAVDSSVVPPSSSTDGWHLRFTVHPDDETTAHGLLARLPAQARLVALHPGSGAAVKRWRAAAWAELAGELARRHDVQIIFTGSAGEASQIDPVMEALRTVLSPMRQPISLAGATNLGSLAAVYRRCALVIGPDSGPLHLAVAVGTPTVHLYGPVDRRTFGPWGSARRHRAVVSDWGCIPCNRLDWPDSALEEHGCIHDITVEQVLAEAASLLDETGW